MPVTGGGRLKRHLAQQRAKARRPAVERVSVGFHDQTASLAKRLEYGDASQKLPERAAFRRGIPAANEAFVSTMKSAGGEPSRANATRAGSAAAEAIKQSYLTYSGPGLSERQRSRKAGTPFETTEPGRRRRSKIDWPYHKPS